MSIFSVLRAFLSRSSDKPISEWYSVSFNENSVRLEVEPPGKTPWTAEFSWANIVRVCFKADFPLSDGIYIFTLGRSASYAIPIDAQGGGEFWSEILRRGLFDAGRAIEAATSVHGLFCWPHIDPEAAAK